MSQDAAQQTSLTDARQKGSLALWLSHSPVMIPWLVTVAVLLLLKYQNLVQAGFRIAERALGRLHEQAYGDTFSWIELASFFAWDGLLCLGLIPASLIMLSRVAGRRWGLRVSTALSMIVALLLFIQSQSMAIVGVPTSYSLLLDVVGFARADPQMVTQYISLSAILKIVVVQLSIVMAYLVVNRWHHILWLTYGTAGGGLAALLFCVTVVAIQPLPETRYHHSMLKDYVVYFVSGPAQGSFTLEAPSPARLKAHFKTLSGTQGRPDRATESDVFGSHKGSDLIVIIMETAPVRVMDMTPGNPLLTHTAALFEHALYSNHHYSTYPYSNLAIYSMLTSWYPTGNTLNMIDENTPALPSFMHPLIRQGYQTGLYLPCHHAYDFDKRVYQLAGLRNEYIACDDTRYRARAGQDPVNQRVVADTMAFDAMKADIEKHHAQGTPYAYVIAPQLGHGPWLDLDGQGHNDVQARGRAIVKKQDEMIGEIVTMLQNNNKLDDTVIVITGDHGIRTKKEDPDFPGNTADAYSFNVPLLVHAPKAKKTGTVYRPTSHIDIFPTILDLMGSAYPDTVIQGRSLYTPATPRALFFNANYYLGADAYFDNGQFYGISHTTGEAFVNPQALDFQSVAPLPEDSVQKQAITETIDNMYRFQNYWQQYFLAHPEALGSTMRDKQ